MSRHRLHPVQMDLAFGQRAEIEQLIAVRADIQAQAQATAWRLRLVALESIMMGALILGAGLAMRLPLRMCLRNALAVAAACLLAGMLTVTLAALSGRLISRIAGHLRARRAPRS